LPLPVAPVGGVVVGPGVDLVENAKGGAVFVWGVAAWCWDGGDVVGRRLAAVQAVETKAAMASEVAGAFGVSELTLRRWRRDWVERGVAGLTPGKRGPKGPSKLTDEMVAEIRRFRVEGESMDAIAERVGVSRDSVWRVLTVEPVPDLGGGPAVKGGEGLVPLARPEPREEERQAARRGELMGAAPVITEGASLPLAGALLVLPALAATGCSRWPTGCTPRRGRRSTGCVR
jgi:transposase